MPSKDLPTVNSSAVTNAPTHTSDQRMSTSGTSLKMSANSPVIIANEKAKLTAYQNSPPATSVPRSKPATETAMVTRGASDSSVKNAGEAASREASSSSQASAVCLATSQTTLSFT